MVFHKKIFLLFMRRNFFGEKTPFQHLGLGSLYLKKGI